MGWRETTLLHVFDDIPKTEENSFSFKVGQLYCICETRVHRNNKKALGNATEKITNRMPIQTPPLGVIHVGRDLLNKSKNSLIPFFSRSIFHFMFYI